MQMVDELSFEIYFGKIEEIKFPKKSFLIFLTALSEIFFSGKFQEMMIGIGSRISIVCLGAVLLLHT